METSKHLSPGDRVILSETIEDLTAGLEGTVVSHIDYFDPERQCFCDAPVRVLGVQFDSRFSVSVNRRNSEGKIVQVISFCKPQANAK